MQYTFHYIYQHITGSFHYYQYINSAYCFREVGIVDNDTWDVKETGVWETDVITNTWCTHHIYFRISDQPTPAQEDFPFIEQPSEEFFCPVTYGLLLQPHLTACCGKHLSQEAATRIQGEGGACPLCNEPHLTTVLDKRFRRQVNEFRVFCHHEDRGCGWQGELSDLERHVQSCPMKTTPLMTDLLKLPV